MKRLMHALFFAVLGSLILSACGNNVENRLAGVWEVIEDDVQTGRYLEFASERVIIRDGYDSEPITASYRLIELKKGKLLIELAESNTAIYEFFLEGVFQSKNLIDVTQFMDKEDKVVALKRIKNLDKEFENSRVEDEKQQEIAEKEQAVADKERAKLEQQRLEREQKIAEQTEERQQQQDKEIADASRKEQQEREKKEKETVAPAPKPTPAPAPAPKSASASSNFSQRADALSNKIMADAKQTYPGDQDLHPGFYGQYYDDWDKLLNDIWGHLKQTMAPNAFEQLRNDQRQWIKTKETGFNNYQNEHASERAASSDFIAFETADRVQYLIYNYVQ